MARPNNPKDDAPEPHAAATAVATDDDRNDDPTIEMATLPADFPRPARDSGDFPHPDDDNSGRADLATTLAALLRPLVTALAAKFRAEAALAEAQAATRRGADAAEPPAPAS